MTLLSTSIPLFLQTNNTRLIHLQLDKYMLFTSKGLTMFKNKTNNHKCYSFQMSHNSNSGLTTNACDSSDIHCFIAFVTFSCQSSPRPALPQPPYPPLHLWHHHFIFGITLPLASMILASFGKALLGCR